LMRERVLAIPSNLPLKIEEFKCLQQMLIN